MINSSIGIFLQFGISDSSISIKLPKLSGVLFSHLIILGVIVYTKLVTFAFIFEIVLSNSLLLSAVCCMRSYFSDHEALSISSDNFDNSSS